MPVLGQGTRLGPTSKEDLELKPFHKGRTLRGVPQEMA